MTAIKSENWDSVTPPAIPAGWTVDTQLVTTTTGAVSAPNSLAYLTANINDVIVPFATWATQDTNTGDVQVSATLNMAATTAVQQFYINARSNAILTHLNYNSSTYYSLEVDRSGGTPGLSIRKVVAGTSTFLTSAVGTLADATNYKLYLICQGTALSVKCQRLSDSNWMNASGTFVVDATGNTTVFSITDTSIAGAGYAGIGCYAAASAGNIITDDFLLETYPVTSPPPPPPPPATDTAYPVKVFYGGMPG